MYPLVYWVYQLRVMVVGQTYHFFCKLKRREHDYDFESSDNTLKRIVRSVDFRVGTYGGGIVLNEVFRSDTKIEPRVIVQDGHVLPGVESHELGEGSYVLEGSAHSAERVAVPDSVCQQR